MALPATAAPIFCSDFWRPLLPPLNFVIDVPQSLPQILNRCSWVFLPSARYVFDRVPQAVTKAFIINIFNDFNFPVRIVSGVVYTIVQLNASYSPSASLRLRFLNSRAASFSDRALGEVMWIFCVTFPPVPARPWPPA